MAPYGALGGVAGPQAVADQFLAPQDARYHVREQRVLAEHESERGAVGMMPLVPLQPRQPQVHEQKERSSHGREGAPITGRASVNTSTRASARSGSGVPRQFMSSHAAGGGGTGGGANNSVGDNAERRFPSAQHRPRRTERRPARESARQLALGIRGGRRGE